MAPPIVAVDQYHLSVCTGEPALEERLSVDRLTHHDLRAPSREPPVVVRMSQRSIQPRRRNFERVSRRDDVFHVEHGAQIAADMRAIVDAYALFCRRSRAGAVD